MAKKKSPKPAEPQDPQAEELLAHLRANAWSVSTVARLLGISRVTVYRRMHRHGIVSPNKQDAMAA